MGLSLSPTGTFSGVTALSTSAGVVTFSNLRILSANTFTLTATSGLISATSSSFTVINYVYTITLTSTATSTSPSVYFSFTINVALSGEDGHAYTGSSTIAASESTSSLQGDSSKTITTGSGTFSVYLTSIGTKSIVFTSPAVGSSPAVTNSISITALTEILKITSLTPIVTFI